MSTHFKNMLFSRRHQSGQALIIALVLLMLGALILGPLLSYMGTGLKTGQVYEKKTSIIYAADAGIEDAKWKIEYNKLTGYSPYNFNTPFAYTIAQGQEIGENINGSPVDVEIQNIWIPEGFIDKPSEITARNIIESNKLVVSGTTTATGIEVNDPEHPSQSIKISQYKIKIVYDRGSEDQIALKIDKIGIWLPRGFVYFSDDHQLYNGNPIRSQLEELNPPYQATPDLYDSNGNQMVVWEFPELPAFSTFPPPLLTAGSPLVLEFTFFFRSLGQPDDRPDAVAWIKTTGVEDIPFSWNADIKIFHIQSTAGETMAEAWIAKNELRTMSSAVSGDYFATGNTLMRDAVYDSGHIRDTWLNPDHSSSATVPLKNNPEDSGVPRDGDVALAYLYWTGWKDESNKILIPPLNPDTCTNFNNWSAGSAWSILNNSFGGHYSTGAGRYLTLGSGLNLSSYSSGGGILVTWQQYVTSLLGFPASGPDNGSNINTYWTRSGTNAYNNTAWSNPSGYYSAHYDPSPSPGPNGYRDLTLTNPVNLSGFPPGTVTLNWKQWVTIPSSPTTVSGWPDTCTSSNFTTLWTNGGDWSQSGGQYQARHNPDNGSDTKRYLTLKNSVNLNSYGTKGTITVYWDLSKSSNQSLSAADGLDFEYSLDGGNIWTTIEVFRGNTIPNRPTYNIPVNSLPSSFLIRFKVIGTSSTSPYIRIDNIHLQVTPELSANDGLDFYLSADNGDTWSEPIQAFRGAIDTSRPGNNNYSYIIPDQYLTSGFKVKLSLVGFEGTGLYCNIDDFRINWPNPGYPGPSDGLDISFSGDGGNTWGGTTQAFRGNIGTSAKYKSVLVPAQYVTDNFKLRFTLIGFASGGQYCNIDNIQLSFLPADTSVYFKINGQQVYFDSQGNPQAGPQEINADKVEVITNEIGGSPRGFSYACFKDVTALVRKYTQKQPDPATNYPGNGTYTVGNVDATLGINGRDSNGDQLAHAGWSIIIIYTSPDTLGHQLYLYDRFSFADDDTDLDFDHDGLPGGDISGFIVPDRIQYEDGSWEKEAARITTFVGEGDEWITNDWIAFNAPPQYWDLNLASDPPSAIPDSYKLWDGISVSSNSEGHPNNIWNSRSTTFTADGVDIDTFSILWDDGRISHGDTKAHIDIYTYTDNWNLIYIILSFRSKITTGGALSYLIHG